MASIINKDYFSNLRIALDLPMMNAFHTYDNFHPFALFNKLVGDWCLLVLQLIGSLSAGLPLKSVSGSQFWLKTIWVNLWFHGKPIICSLFTLKHRRPLSNLLWITKVHHFITENGTIIQLLTIIQLPTTTQLFTIRKWFYVRFYTPISLPHIPGQCEYWMFSEWANKKD